MFCFICAVQSKFSTFYKQYFYANKRLYFGKQVTEQVQIKFFDVQYCVACRMVAKIPHTFNF